MEERIKGRRQKEGRPSQTHFLLHPEVFAVPHGWWMQLLTDPCEACRMEGSWCVHFCVPF